MIFAKPIHQAPPRLQRILIKVQGYKFKIIYKLGSTMALADTLLRDPNLEKAGEVELDIHVDGATLKEVDPMNFSQHKQSAIRESTQDPSLHRLS